jgi:hypothetical protein
MEELSGEQGQRHRQHYHYDALYSSSQSHFSTMLPPPTVGTSPSVASNNPFLYHAHSEASALPSPPTFHSHSHHGHAHEHNAGELLRFLALIRSH